MEAPFSSYPPWDRPQLLSPRPSPLEGQVLRARAACLTPSPQRVHRANAPPRVNGDAASGLRAPRSRATLHTWKMKARMGSDLPTITCQAGGTAGSRPVSSALYTSALPAGPSAVPPGWPGFCGPQSRFTVVESRRLGPSNGLARGRWYRPSLKPTFPSPKWDRWMSPW